MPCCGGLTKGFVDLPLGMLWGIDAVREGKSESECIRRRFLCDITASHGHLRTVRRKAGACRTPLSTGHSPVYWGISSMVKASTMSPAP